MNRTCKVCSIFNDKKFYIYLTIVTIVTIIGCSYLLSDPKNGFPTLLWLFINLMFLLFVYNFEKINVIKNARSLYFIRFTFGIVILLQLIWAIEFNKMKKMDLNIPIIMIIIIAISYCAISYNNHQKLAVIFSLIYILLWFFILFYFSVLPQN